MWRAKSCDVTQYVTCCRGRGWRLAAARGGWQWGAAAARSIPDRRRGGCGGGGLRQRRGELLRLGGCDGEARCDGAGRAVGEEPAAPFGERRVGGQRGDFSADFVEPACAERLLAKRRPPRSASPLPTGGGPPDGLSSIR